MKMDESLALFQALIIEMYRKVRLMHQMALEVIHTGDKEKALQLIRMDDFVNHMEEEVNDQAQSVLALLSPVASDLRKVIAGIKIASDLERIGDYAKNYLCNIDGVLCLGLCQCTDTVSGHQSGWLYFFGVETKRKRTLL